MACQKWSVGLCSVVNCIWLWIVQAIVGALQELWQGRSIHTLCNVCCGKAVGPLLQPIDCFARGFWAQKQLQTRESVCTQEAKCGLHYSSSFKAETPCTRQTASASHATADFRKRSGDLLRLGWYSCLLGPWQFSASSKGFKKQLHTDKGSLAPLYLPQTLQTLF